MARTGPGFGEPVADLRDEAGRIPWGTLSWQRSDGEAWRLTSIDRPALDKRMLDSVIIESRPLFLPTEDVYLPDVVRAIQELNTRERALARRPLRAHVAQVVTGSRIGASGPIFHSGRLEIDNGLGPGKLLGSDVIAMDYIYGVALHEDDVRLARLANVDPETAIEAVMYHLNDLLHIVGNVRAQIEHDIASGYFTVVECSDESGASAD
jgi:hypothetical protein